MARLENLKPSISELEEKEARELVASVRLNRRTVVQTMKTPVTPTKRVALVNKMDAPALEALLAALEELE